jgi:L-alanine-DL-glutamate epimerase-like enolase superfamily enzyme
MLRRVSVENVSVTGATEEYGVTRPTYYQTKGQLALSAAQAKHSKLVDLALWDIAGKVYGQPVHKLLGAAWRTRLKAY